ncbi:MAG: hypothetical protein ABNH00_04805 [Dokdonia sp.]|jgi:hypothetical protein|nr:hypothetical protein [Cytophagaceae bacterium]
MGSVKFTIIKGLKKNNRFNYTPRYFNGKDDVESAKYPTKLDAYSENYNRNDYGSHWRDAREARRNKANVGFNGTIWIIIAALFLIFMYIIDFDLSIFS